MSLLTIILLSILGGGAVGVGGTLLLTRDSGSAPEAVAATATVVDAAVREDVTAATTRQMVATAPAVNLAVQAAVQPGAAPSTVALAAYALCIAGSQEQAQGAAAYGCMARGAVLDGLLAEP